MKELENNDPVQSLLIKLSLPDQLLHTYACNCAEHALRVVISIGGDKPPYSDCWTILESKREWLKGEYDTEELRSDMHLLGTYGLYWGNPLHAGAAVLAAAWVPDTWLMFAIDEGYAEKITSLGSLLEAVLTTVEESRLAVGHAAVDRANYLALVQAETNWQYDHLLALAENYTNLH